MLGQHRVELGLGAHENVQSGRRVNRRRPRNRLTQMIQRIGVADRVPRISRALCQQHLHRPPPQIVEHTLGHHRPRRHLRLRIPLPKQHHLLQLKRRLPQPPKLLPDQLNRQRMLPRFLKRLLPLRARLTSRLIRQNYDKPPADRGVNLDAQRHAPHHRLPGVAPF